MPEATVTEEVLKRNAGKSEVTGSTERLRSRTPVTTVSHRILQPPVGEAAARQDAATIPPKLAATREALTDVARESFSETQTRFAAKAKIDNLLGDKSFQDKIPLERQPLFFFPADGSDPIPIFVPEGEYTPKDVQDALETAGITGKFSLDEKCLETMKGVPNTMLDGIKETAKEVAQQATMSQENPDTEPQPGTEQLTVIEKTGRKTVITVPSKYTSIDINKALTEKGIKGTFSPANDTGQGLAVQLRDEQARRIVMIAEN